MIPLRAAARHARLPCISRRNLGSVSLPAGLNGVSEADLAHFSRILPGSSILSTLAPKSLNASELSIYNEDWMGKYKGKASTVLKPKTTQEVSEILKWCWEKRIGVVPQGGNTGLVGGSVPLQDELVINLGNMNKVRSFDPVTGILVADAGCILEALSEHISPHNHIMPLDLGAKGSCMIGGNVATNAGGLRLLRYGSLHGSVLGLEVVLPDGTILDQLSTLRKDNTGYDLKQLFIGAEGTLGIITGVSILTAAAPRATNNVLLSLPSFDNVLPLFMQVKQHLSEILSAFEFIDRRAYDLAVKHGQGKALGDEEVGDAECFVLIETSGGKGEHDSEKLNELLESLYEAKSPLISSGVLSESTEQFASLWALREGITEAVSKEGKAYKYDISIPLTAFKDVVDTTREHLASKGLMREGAVRHVIGYGHVGDGNLHLNIVADQYSDEIQAALEPFVYEVVASYKGSISAEHGIGAMKTHALQYSKNDVSREWMKKLKTLFDSRGIMNPVASAFNYDFKDMNVFVSACEDVAYVIRAANPKKLQCITHPRYNPNHTITTKLIEMIFYNDGPPIRFFVQKDGPTEEKSEIEAIITAEGGILSDKVVRKGYIVLFMDTPEANRIIERWTDPEHPQRYFVSADWVRECRARNRLLRQTFVENGHRVKIHIHNAIANVVSRERLEKTIKLHGGDPSSTMEKADVIITDRETEFFKEMRKQLQGSEAKFVEHLTWVDACVDQGHYYHTPNPVKNRGGRRTGDDRTPFTEEDETNLCKYIASVLPYKETGGRTGNRIYMELMEAAQRMPEMKWALRHTWQSWRERYKKNKDRLDVHVAAIVKSAMSENGYPSNTSGGSSGAGALQETPELAPSWAKRKGSDDDDSSNDTISKKQKSNASSFHTFVFTPALTALDTIPEQPPALESKEEYVPDFRVRTPWNSLEEEIKSIAQSFHFLPDEIRAYYNRSKDLVATRQRFETARRYIDSLP